MIKLRDYIGKNKIILSIVLTVLIILLLQIPAYSSYLGGDNSLIYFLDPDLFINNFIGRNSYNNELGGIGRPFPQMYLENYFTLIKAINYLNINAQIIINFLYIISILIFILIFIEDEKKRNILILLSIIPLCKTGIEHQSISQLVIPVVLIYLIGYRCYVKNQYFFSIIFTIIISYIAPSLLLVVNYIIPIIIYFYLISKKKDTFIVYILITAFVITILNYNLIESVLEVMKIKNGYLPDANYTYKVSFTYGEFENFIYALFGAPPINYVNEKVNKILLLIYVISNIILIMLIVIENGYKKIEYKYITIHLISCAIYSNWLIVDLSVYISDIAKIIPIIAIWKNSTDKFTYLVMFSYIMTMASLLKLKYKN